MTKPEILLEVANILHRTVLVEWTPISEDTNLINDLGIDSLDRLEVVMECEDHFKINITDQNQEKIESVRDLVNVISTMIYLEQSKVVHFNDMD